MIKMRSGKIVFGKEELRKVALAAQEYKKSGGFSGCGIPQAAKERFKCSPTALRDAMRKAGIQIQ